MGRYPSTVEVTVGVSVSYEEPEGDQAMDPSRRITGSAEDIAVVLNEYADLGVGHLICRLTPDTSESLSKLSDALRVYRGAEPARAT